MAVMAPKIDDLMHALNKGDVSLMIKHGRS